MENYWGGQGPSSSSGEDFPINSRDRNFDSPEKTGLEERKEKLIIAWKAVKNEGVFLYIIDPIDIDRCKSYPAGEGIFEVVSNDTVVGYSSENLFEGPESSGKTTYQ